MNAAPGNPLRHISAALDIDPAIARVMQDERGDPDRRKNVTDVDLDVHPIERFERPRTNAQPNHPR